MLNIYKTLTLYLSIEKLEGSKMRKMYFLFYHRIINCTFMKGIIMSNLNDNLIVTINYSCRQKSTQIFKKPLSSE